MASQLNIAQTLIKSVETIMDPSASNEERQVAQKICEEFKENAKGCVGCGLDLASLNNSPYVRHFGLQIVEHCIKYCWNEIGQEEKAVLKRNILIFIDQGTKDILEEEQHIKDAVSRVLVELIKREWPQLWQDLFADFTVLCEKGAKQTEIILQTLLRLSEDVVRFENLPASRRSDITQALTSQMENIFSFFNFIFLKNLEIYKQAGPESLKACKICQAMLDTLGGFVEWVAIKHINSINLMSLLCSLLLDKELCLKASECLLLIVGRKGKLVDRKPLLVLFEEQPITVLLQAGNHATTHITESTNFIFLKRLCEILLEIGKQLCMLWGSTERVNCPPNFKMYLDSVVAFTQHPSQSLQQMIYSVWVTLLRHPMASKDPHFESILPTLIKCCTACLHKVGFPSQHNSVSCDYSRLEFDSDEDFGSVLSSLRMSVMESIRMITLMAPKLTFMAASSWLREELQKPITTGAGNEGDKGICNLSSPSYLSWDACSVFLENVMSKLFQAEGEKPDVKEGIELLHSVLAYENQDPLILSAVLSCVSGLFPFLTYTPETLPKVLAKIFDAVVFNLPGQTKSTRSQAVKNVRVHACSIVVKICKQYPELLLPEFEHLYNCVKHLDSDKEQLSQMEKTILVEALIIVSNQFFNFDQQSAFLEEVISPVKQLWTSPDFTRAFTSPEYFMSYVGLNQPAVEPSSADTCGINRSHITYCVHTILAMIKRSQCPQDFALAQKGGFVVSSDGGTVMRNPATAHIIPLLDNLLTMLRTYCCLCLPQYISLRHQDFVKAYDLMEHECQNVLGVTPTYQDNTDSLVHRQPLERMQNFISGVFENGFHILGNASQCLGVEFYSVTPLITTINEILAMNFKLLPDHRMRSLIRNFVKPFMLYCPKNLHSSVCIQLLGIICPEIFERLKSKWLVVSQRIEDGDENEDEHQESQEVIEDLLLRNLTKEYLELLTLVLSGKGGGASDVKEEEAMDDGYGSVKGGLPPANAHAVFKELTELGHTVVRTEELYPSIVMCLLTAFSWPDTWVCYRAAVLLWPVCKQLEANRQMSVEAHQHVFMSILSGLQLNGQHAACQSILTTMALSYYETYHKDYPVLAHVLAKIPGIRPSLITELDEKLSSPPKAGLDKKKKQIFKKIIENIIGKSIGQQFRRIAQYTNMPRLFLESRRNKRVMFDNEDDDSLGLCELFEPSKSS